MIKIFSIAVGAALSVLLVILGFLFVRSLQHPVAALPDLPTFGQGVSGDLDGDGDDDMAVLVYDEKQDGSVLYYAKLLINDGKKSFATNQMYLGDHIAPQTVEIREGRAVYNFAERATGEPLSVQPSVGKSVWVNYDKSTRQIGEWVRNFEGESADGLTEEQARAIAESTCIKGGEAVARGLHNKNTQTWWFDANRNATSIGCNAACVVSEVTKSAYVDWRCASTTQQ